jgi:hypothetical protein
MACLLVVLERATDDPDRVGNFRVHGAGQLLRERLWAMTEIIPLDVGVPVSDLFRRAVDRG